MTSNKIKRGNGRGKMARLAVLAGIAWAVLIGLIFLYNSGQYSFWFPGRVLAYVLLLLAPALTFMPIGGKIGSIIYGYVSVISWATFGFILAFVPPNSQTSASENTLPLILMVSALFGVVISIFLPIFYFIGSKLDNNRLTRYDMRRALRESVLLGSYLVLMAVLRTFGVMNPIYAVGIFLIVVVVELLMLSRSHAML